MDEFICEECRKPIPADEYIELVAKNDKYLLDDNVYIQHKTCECHPVYVLETLEETKTLKMVRQTIKEEGLSVKANNGE